MCGRIQLPLWNEMIDVACRLGTDLPEGPQHELPKLVRPGSQLPLFNDIEGRMRFVFA